ncbi:MAG: malate dehydrogenase [Candidatus Omnitrophica bacterium]|nr:malate dehydrogenase [Candidatus Omnitrophota bacterium]
MLSSGRSNLNMKVSIIGAGNVGATLGMRIIENDTADVVLLDIAKNMAIGKSFDLLDAASIIGHERYIKSTDDYKDIKESDIVVVTAGVPRKPGMTREELVSINARIVKGACVKIKSYAPQAIVIMVTNPLDALTYLAYKVTGFERRRVFGMAGLLDASRFVNLIAHELKVPRSSIETCILGSHGDTMVPVISKTRVGGKDITKVLPKDKLDLIVKRTRDRGAEIVSLLGSGSAYYSPSAAVFKMIGAILKDSGDVLVVSANLEGEYGLEDISIGVPCKIGKAGIEKIIELDLAPDEKSAFKKSAQAIKDSVKSL